MSDVICVTNRTLCRGDFLSRIEAIAGSKPAAIILREKDLTEEEYRALASQVMTTCARQQVPCILHYHKKVAEQLKASALHVPLPVLREMTSQERKAFQMLGASCHSVSEAMEAEALGCTYLVAGHIFATDCKKGLEPRGLFFLREVCKSVRIPVYAIGGINSENIRLVKEAGAKGGCIMSGLMICDNPAEYIKEMEFLDENSTDNCRQ